MLIEDNINGFVAEFARKRFCLTPLQALHWAVLENAIIDITKRPCKPGTKRYRLAAVARAWVAGKCDSPISFETCCECLGLDVAAAREAVLHPRFAVRWNRSERIWAVP